MPTEFKKNSLIISFWMFGTLSARILYYLFDYTGMSDIFGYYDTAMIKLEEGDRILSSGLEFAYANALSKYLGFFGNDINKVFVWQLILGALALLFYFLGALNFWGMTTALISSSLLSFSPVLIDIIKICSPEEYYMLYLFIGFFALSVFFKYTRNHHWTRCLRNELIVLGVGIYIGVLVSWNYIGILLLVIFFAIVIRNYRIFKDKSWLQFMVDGDIEEKYQIMSVFSQTVIVFFGIFLGMFFTMLHLTGYSGKGITDQFLWYFGLFKKFPLRTMDFDTICGIWILVAMILSMLIFYLIKLREAREADELMKEQEKSRKELLAGEKAFVDRDEQPVEIKDEFPSDKKARYFITKEGHRVPYLDNPVPMPEKKKHTGMRFDLEELTEENKSAIIAKDITDENVSLNPNSQMLAAGAGIEKIVKLTAPAKVIIKAFFDHAVSKNDDFEIKKDDDEFDLVGRNEGFDIDDDDVEDFDDINASDDFDI